jgi:hypothetical protein
MLIIKILTNLVIVEHAIALAGLVSVLRMLGLNLP